MLGATGWVKNEYDGSVIMEIQGTEEQIDLALRAIRGGRFIEIDRMESRTIPAEEEESGFRTE